MGIVGHRQCNPHHKLSEEETRVYAMGMAAARRGDKGPRGQLPPGLVKVWWMGWRRVGRKLYEVRDVRSRNGEALVQSPHMVRTEVQTLEEACDLITARQNGAKAAASRAPADWHDELHGHKLNILAPIRRKKPAELLAVQERMSELEERAIARVEQCIEILTFSVDEMSLFSPMNWYHPAVCRTALISVIQRMCHMLKRDLPEFSVTRKPGQKSQRKCLECRALLGPDEFDYCLDCRPANDFAKANSDYRRHLEDETKHLTRIIGKVKKAITVKAVRHEGYGGRASLDAGDVSAREREEDFFERGPPEDGAGPGDPGDAEG
jgi:hypothetical protein